MLILAGFAACAWLWLALAHGRFWSSGVTPVISGSGGEASSPEAARPVRVAVVVPARDEAEHLVATLRSLLRQQFAGELCVVLVDDNSTDATGQLAQQMADDEQRLRVLAGAPLETGWTGKLWAVAQGLAQPEVRAADYVLLTDADIVHAPSHVASLLARAQRERLDLVSEMVRLRCISFAERATIPAFVFFFQMLYPFRWVSDQRRRTAAAAGGTMLLSRRALDRIGGVDCIRGALIDDVALAREVKRGGYAISLGHADEAVSERGYAQPGDIWKMVSRTAYVQLGYSPALLLGTCVGLLLLYALPVFAAVLGTGVVRGLGLFCWATMALLFQPTLRRYGRSPLWGAALPAIALFYCAATCGSAWNFYRGHGGGWKSRTYPAAVDAAGTHAAETRK